jgi:colanic acid/amylovoran biosynthesis protein
MTILIDSCAYTCQNVGDLAMLSVAVSRLRTLWPDAVIEVITAAPEIAAAHCGNVNAVPLDGRQLVLQHRLIGRLERMLPAHVAKRWEGVEARLRSCHPTLLGFALRLKLGIRGQESGEAAAFLSAVHAADLVVVSGAGVITDAFLKNALGVLATLELAGHRGIPTAMFGQGLGPITSGELRSRAAQVLPSVRLIAIRERLASLPLLASLGVSPDRVIVTGDDAIELALRAPAAEAAFGGAVHRDIGVNVRVAPYSEIGPEHFGVLREALRSASKVYDAELVPIPIAHRNQMDPTALRELLAGIAADDLDCGTSLNTPDLVIRRVGQCRIVVTGSYHAGVFALAQGVPTVALARSRYYRDKMSGLADQFGEGCQVVAVEAGLSASRIEAAIGAAWDGAERLRPALLARAAEQVERGRAAYARLLDLVPAALGQPSQMRAASSEFRSGR